MTHWPQARQALAEPKLKEKVRAALQAPLAAGYSFNDAHYDPGKPSVEIFFKRLGNGDSEHFAEAMRLLGIPYTRPCGLSALIATDSKESIREFKTIFLEAAGFPPAWDTNQSVE